ncbi:hypothetical protein FHS18_005641 [Paenibacillus phyllosphaerae]|uniref:DUF2642 domain-containing protein n=1 Tax=Paenibacillus phyllosphaerae TaxID=274593 RepID=A0A7W5B3K1_9BACL|nr:hypothetical protein [Paenibacillus phyllosphaerae]MBB3113529.1 hypothetical protein [Paenibacillus phyllosphaerae]
MFPPNQSFTPGAMPPSATVAQKAAALLGRQVGISLRDGTGVSGTLCSIQGGEIYIMQYLYASQFATFHYPLQDVADINPFPACR